jgi:hypothetical protein
MIVFIMALDISDFFSKPKNTEHRRYEALRAFFIGELSANEAAKKFGFSKAYFKKIRYLYSTMIKNGNYPFFNQKKKGPKNRSTNEKIVEQIVELRKKNHSVGDIKTILDSLKNPLALATINNILKDQGFAPLPRRTRKERYAITIPEKLKAPVCQPLELEDEEFNTEKCAGVLVFLPLIEEMGITKAIENPNFPHTSVLNALSSVLSFLALKLIGNCRLSHDQNWNLDRSLGLFAGLNVLPKNSTLSSYSYRISRAQNRELLIKLSRIFKDEELENGEFNLDFKAIPHWGDESILEKNWAGSRSKAIKSLLALIVQDPDTGLISYTNAEIKHKNQSEAVIEFVDFWKEGRGVCPKMLVFDSKFTTYHHLSELNSSNIKFLTIRRRGKKLKEKVYSIPESEWKYIRVYTSSSRKKYKTIRVNESYAKLRNYNGEVRQFIITNHGRPQPTFMVTNDFKSAIGSLIKKYARRWLVEQEIAEQVQFFHLNQPSSSIVVKVDFDLTISLVAHNLYRVLAKNLPGFENCTASTIWRNFLENGAKITVAGDDIEVAFKKKTHLPILFEAQWMRKKTLISFLGKKISYTAGTAS